MDLEKIFSNGRPINVDFIEYMYSNFISIIKEHGLTRDIMESHLALHISVLSTLCEGHPEPKTILSSLIQKYQEGIYGLLQSQ